VSRICAQCGTAICAACAGVKQYGTAKVEVCSYCGGVLRPVDAAAEAAAHGDARAARALGEPPFYTRPLDLLRFPFTGLAGPIALVFFAGLQAVLLTLGQYAVARRALAWVIFHGLLLSVASYTIRRVSVGDDRLGAPQDFHGVWEDVYAPYTRSVVVLAPIIAAFSVALYLGAEDNVLRSVVTRPLPLALLVYGLLVLPGGVLQAAGEARWRDIFNPLSHARLLIVAPKESFAAIGYTVALVGAYVALRIPLHRGGFLAEAVDGSLNAYLALVLARMFGLYYRDVERHRDRGA
jgi:hypothetical protein